jgi:uncharacterized lipoprotein YmbA
MKISVSVLALAAILLASCGSTPTSKLYRVSASADDSHRVAADRRRIEVVSVRIPALWDRPQMVVSKPGSEVSFSEFNRWADPLSSEVPRVFARNLARVLDNPTVWLREDFAGAKPDLRVQVVIQRLEAVSGQGLKLEATWLIRSGDGGGSRSGSTTISEPLADDGYDAIVAATNRALLALSRDVAKDLQVPLAR